MDNFSLSSIYDKWDSIYGTNDKRELWKLEVRSKKNPLILLIAILAEIHLKSILFYRILISECEFFYLLFKNNCTGEFLGNGEGGRMDSFRTREIVMSSKWNRVSLDTGVTVRWNFDFSEETGIFLKNVCNIAGCLHLYEFTYVYNLWSSGVSIWQWLPISI